MLSVILTSGDFSGDVSGWVQCIINPFFGHSVVSLMIIMWLRWKNKGMRWINDRFYNVTWFMAGVMINGCLMELQHNFCKIMFYIVPQDSEVRSFNDLMVVTLFRQTFFCILMFIYLLNQSEEVQNSPFSEVCSSCASAVKTQPCIISCRGTVFDFSWWEGELHLKVLKQRNNGILDCLWKAIERRGAHIKSVSLGSWHDATSQT